LLRRARQARRQDAAGRRRRGPDLELSVVTDK